MSKNEGDNIELGEVFVPEEGIEGFFEQLYAGLHQNAGLGKLTEGFNDEYLSNLSTDGFNEEKPPQTLEGRPEELILLTKPKEESTAPNTETVAFFNIISASLDKLKSFTDIKNGLTESERKELLNVVMNLALIGSSSGDIDSVMNQASNWFRLFQYNLFNEENGNICQDPNSKIAYLKELETLQNQELLSMVLVTQKNAQSLFRMVETTYTGYEQEDLVSLLEIAGNYIGQKYYHITTPTKFKLFKQAIYNFGALMKRPITEPEYRLKITSFKSKLHHLKNCSREELRTHIQSLRRT